MKSARGLLFVFLLLGFFYVGTPEAFALPDNIAPVCGTGNNAMCTVCDVVKLGMNILNFFVFFSTLFATLLFVNAGVLYLFSPANPGNISKAHHIFTNTLIGILIILCAWLVVDTVMRNLYSENAGSEFGNMSRFGPWNTILCRPGGAAQIQAPTAPVAPPVSGVTPSDNCSDMAAVAAKYNVPYPLSPMVHPDLQPMINCILRSSEVVRLRDSQTIYTRDLSYPNCMYTRGDDTSSGTCTPSCSHAPNSCHYGGRSGTQGAMGADFNAKDGSLAGEGALCRAIASAINTYNCQGVVNWETSPAHTHVSLNSCDNTPRRACPSS